jgi:hypothetical protein
MNYKHSNSCSAYATHSNSCSAYATHSNSCSAYATHSNSCSAYATHSNFTGNPRKAGIINITDAPYLPISLREKQDKAKPTRKPSVSKEELAIRAKLNAWRDDPRMVFLANPNRDLTAKECKEWERNIGQYQHRYS